MEWPIFWTLGVLSSLKVVHFSLSLMPFVCQFELYHWRLVVLVADSVSSMLESVV